MCVLPKPFTQHSHCANMSPTIDTGAKLRKKMMPQLEKDPENDTDSDELSDVEDNVEESDDPPPANPSPDQPKESVKDVVETSVQKPETKKRKRAVKKVVPTSDPNVRVHVRQRAVGRPKGPKTVVVYKEDLAEDEPSGLVVQYKSRVKGRPKQKVPEIQIQEEAAKEPVVHYPVVKPTGKRELARIAREERIAQLEEAAGRALGRTKKGEVDRRTIAKRTPQQLAATKRMLEANDARRTALKNSHAKEIAKETVKELASSRQAAPIYAHAPAPAVNRPKPREYTMKEIFA